MNILTRPEMTKLVEILHAMPEGESRDSLDNWMIANNIYVELAKTEDPKHAGNDLKQYVDTIYAAGVLIQAGGHTHKKVQQVANLIVDVTNEFMQKNDLRGAALAAKE